MVETSRLASASEAASDPAQRVRARTVPVPLGQCCGGRRPARPRRASTSSRRSGSKGADRDAAQRAVCRTSNSVLAHAADHDGRL